MGLDHKNIPIINSEHNIILFDGVCKLCNAWCRFVIKYDVNHIFKLTSMQSEEGQLILKHFNLPTENFTSVFYVENNTVYAKSTAFIKITRLLSYPVKFLSVLRYFPLSLRDFIYDAIARNRYNIFGRYKHCLLPTADYPDRYINKTDVDNKELN